MTAVEAYELTTGGGASDFARLIAACESVGPYCLIGGLAGFAFSSPPTSVTRNSQRAPWKPTFSEFAHELPAWKT